MKRLEMNKKLVIGLMALLVLVTACSSADKKPKLNRFPDATTPISLANKQVLLVAYDAVTGDVAADKAFVAAVAKELGTMKFLPEVPGNMRNARFMAESGLNNQGVVDRSSESAQFTDEILKLAAGLGSFDTMVMVSAEKDSGMAIPELLNVKYCAAVYDIKEKKVIASYRLAGQRVVAKGAIAQLPLDGMKVVKLLLNGEPVKTK